MPLPSVNATDASVYQGPSASEIVCPLGAVVSGVTVNVEVLVRPEPSVAVRICGPLAVSIAVHE